MAKFTFKSASELNDFVVACQNAFIDPELMDNFRPDAGWVGLTQSWGTPTSYRQLNDNVLELPWTIHTHGEFYSDEVAESEKSFEVSYKSSMGEGKAKIVVNSRSTAPGIKMTTIIPSDKFLRILAGLEEEETGWTAKREAIRLLGWYKIVDGHEERDGRFFDIHKFYKLVNVEENALEMLRSRSREPSDFMKARGLVYK
jgi:hypothetical protein